MLLGLTVVSGGPAEGLSGDKAGNRQQKDVLVISQLWVSHLCGTGTRLVLTLSLVELWSQLAPPSTTTLIRRMLRKDVSHLWRFPVMP